MTVKISKVLQKMEIINRL